MLLPIVSQKRKGGLWMADLRHLEACLKTKQVDKVTLPPGMVNRRELLSPSESLT